MMLVSCSEVESLLSLQPSTRRLILPLLHLQTSASSSGGDSWSGFSASPPVTPELQQVYRVTHHVILKVVLATKLKLRLNVQGDPSPCAKPPVHFKSKIPFWPGLPWPGQATAELYF